MMRIKKTKTTTEEKTRGIRDLLFKMLVSAVIGGILGLLIGYLHFSQQGDLPAFTSRWLALIQGLILPGLLIITLLSIILQESIFRKLKEVSGLLEAAEDEDFHRLDYEEERIGALLVGANVMSQVLCIVLFSFGYSFDYLKDLPALSSCLVFIICFVYCGCMQARYIQLTQAVHPEKKGNVASRKFRQQWLESCDEAEKEIIYQSAYKAYALANTLLGILLFVTLVANLLFHTGILAIIVVGIVYLAQTLTYCRSCVQLKKIKINR